MRATDAHKAWERTAQRVHDINAEIEELRAELRKALEEEVDCRKAMLVAAATTCYWPEEQWAKELLEAAEKHWPKDVEEARKAQNTNEAPELVVTESTPIRPDGSVPVPPSRPRKK